VSKAEGEQLQGRIFVVSADGTGDDTEAIQAALDGVGFFPALGSGVEGRLYHKTVAR
jgi:hypothetical protein